MGGKQRELVHDNLLRLSITPTNKIHKLRENEVEDMTPEKKTREKKESKIEHITLVENWNHSRNNCSNITIIDPTGITDSDYMILHTKWLLPYTFPMQKKQRTSRKTFLHDKM
ncbi:23975_t:CDS:2, partial [Gigaspora rosea]